MPEPQACEAEVVAKRAKAGLVTMAVAIAVAVLTLAGAAATLLVTGLIPLSGLEGRIASAIADRLGPEWRVEAAAAELGRVEGHSQLRVRQVAFHHSSGATIRAPEAVLGYEPLALLRGQIRLVSVDLRGVNVRLGVASNGALMVAADAGAPEIPLQPRMPDTGQWNAFTGVMAAVSTLAKGEGLLGSLETAGMNGARLTLVDPQGRQTAGFEDVDIRLVRIEGGGTRMHVSGRTGQRWKEFAVTLSTGADGAQQADLDIVRFEPAEAVALALGTGGMTVEGLPLRGKASMRQWPDGRRALSAQLNVLPGIIRVPGGPMPEIAVDGAAIAMESVGDFSELTVTSASLQAGQTKLGGSGTLREDHGAWRLALALQGQLTGQDKDPPVTIDQANANIRIDPRTGDVAIDALSVDGPKVHAEMTGVVRKEGESPYQRFAIKARDTDARAALAVWPSWTSPDVHGLLRRQFLAGRLKALSVDLDLAADDHAKLMRGAGLPDEALKVVIDATDVRFLPSDGLPVLSDGVVTGVATGRKVELKIARAAADVGNGRRLDLQDGSFAIPETWTARPQGQVGFRLTGGADGLLALLAYPAIKDFSPGLVEPSALRGSFDLRTTLALPLVDNPPAAEVAVTSTGTLRDIASDTVLGPEKLEGANLALNLDRNGLTIKGDGRVGGDRAQIDLRQNAKGQGEASVAMTLDNAGRQKRGFGPDAGISGPTPVRFVKALGKADDPAPRVEIDLAKASIDSPIPGLNKPAGRPGKVSFTYVADADGPDLENFVLDAPPVLVRGKIELDKQNGFDAASLSTVRLSPGDNVKLDVERSGNVTKVVIRGAVADARPFIKDAQSETRPSKSEKGAKEGDLDIDLDVPILTGFNSEAITNATMKLSKRGGTVRSLAFQGRIGKADVSVRQTPNGPLSVQSENGGALLRFTDLYRRAFGGSLILNVTAGDIQQGELLLRDFTVRDEPALRRVVGEQLAQAEGSDRSPGQQGRPLNVSEVAFTKLRAEFTRSASRLDLNDVVIWGQQVGFTLQGNVDYARDRLDVAGTFVPGYAFNNAFAQVPVVGAILGGGSQYGGLFAVNFRISGAASAPTLSINPLSALAPGILRRFVDPLGGTSLQRQSPQAVPTR